MTGAPIGRFGPSRWVRATLPVREGAWTSLDSGAGRVHLPAMANPLDKEIDAVLRKGQKPESWKRPGAKREIVPGQGGAGGKTPTDESGKPPAATGMNRPGSPQ